MLGVLPEVAKLMLWPAHLQADYSPGEIISARSWGLPQSVGAAILAAFLAGLALAWKRLPVAAFGLLWFALALAPVHNVLLPTGIVLAERTLFLPSVGFTLAVAAALFALLAPEHEARVRRPLRLALLGSVVGVLCLGAWRSSIRYRGFTNQLSFWYMTMKDAPLSYRANMAIADLIYDSKNPDPARFFFRTAIELFPSGGIARTMLGDKYRFEGNCKEASPLYQAVIDTFPKNSIARSSLVACLLWDGEYAHARDVAETGIALKAEVPTYELFVRTADSALAASAPPQSVRIRFDSTKVGVPAVESIQ
jgi:tetratricopeptide (TPR) repeat protein